MLGHVNARGTSAGPRLRQGGRLRWLIPLAVAVAAIAASAPGALQHALYGDEAASARIVSEPQLSDVVEHVRRTESTPPAWYVLAWGVRKADAALSGGYLFENVADLRLLSVLFAAAAAGLTAILARRVLGQWLPATVAGTLVAFGSLPAEYAEQLRAYALVVLVSAGFGLLLSSAAVEPQFQRVAALAVTAWLGMLTHYFFFFVVAAGLVWLLASRSRLPGWRQVSVALAVATLGFLPWLTSFLHQRAHGRYRWIGPFSARELAKLPGSLFFGPDGVAYGIARIAVTAALVAGTVVLWRTLRGRAVVALALLPVLGAGLVWAAGEPIVDERNMLPVVPFMAILVAAALEALPRRFVVVAAVMSIGATVACAAFADATLGRIPYDRVAADLVDLGWRSDQALVVEFPHAVSQPGVAIEVTAPVSWYLPAHPVLLPAQARRPCRTRYVIVEPSDRRRWFARYRREITGVREVAFYDHPVVGHERGRIVIARLRTALRVYGEPFYVQGHRGSCASDAT